MIEIPEMDQSELTESLSEGEPTTKEFLMANIKDSFANSTLGVGFNTFKEIDSNVPDQPASKEQAQENISAYYEKREAKQIDTPVKRMNEAEWKASPYYREGIKFSGAWMEDRAKYMAEVYDQRNMTNLTMELGDNSAFRTGIGFAGQMIGGVPDPVNLIPFGAGFKGAKIGAKLAAGAFEGAVGNIAVSSITRPYWEDRGVDSTWQDYVMDLSVGGVLGGAFSGGGHLITKSMERRRGVTMKTKEAMGRGLDAAVDAQLKGEDFDPKKVEGLEEAVNSLWDIPEVKRSQKVPEMEAKLVELGYSADDARTSIAPMVAHAQAFAEDFGMDMDQFLDKFGVDFQKGEIKNGQIVGVDTSPQGKRLSELVDSEIKSMKDELLFAEKGGQKIFDESGAYVSTTGEGSFPSWYAEMGVKNKEHFDRVLESKSGPIYERIKARAEDRLMNGYESPASGKVEPANEYRQLKGEDEIYFQKQATYKKETKGAITFKEDGKAIISLFDGADKSTIIHESGHLFLNNLERFASMENAPATIKSDLKRIKQWMGASGKIEVKHHEKFARGFEQYLREGKAPRADLQGVFSRFKDWLTSIYKSSEQLKVNLNQDARDVYARLLGADKKPKFEAPAKAEMPEPIFKSEDDIDAAVAEVEARLTQDGTINSVDSEDLQAMREVLEQISTDEKAMDEVFTFFQSGRPADVLPFANKAGLTEKEFLRYVKELDEVLKRENVNSDDLLHVARKFEERKKLIAIEAKKAKRQAFLSTLAKENVGIQARKIIDAGGSPLQAVLSQIEGDSSLRGVEGSGKSVFGTYQSLSQANTSKMHGELKDLSPRIEKLFEDDIDFNENVIKEMMEIREDGKGKPGVTGDELAQKSAAILSQYAENSRLRMNSAGADIGKLDGWVPRTHDVEKMILKGEGAWINYMKENLDLERTFPGKTDKALDRALYETYQNLITDVRKNKAPIEADKPISKTPRNIAKSLGESRILHFKDVAGELSYLKEYGQGSNILETMTRHLDGMARKTALMERLGPNPDSVLASTVENLRQDIRDKKIFKDATDEQRKNMLEELGDKSSIISREKALGKSMMFMMGEANSMEALRFKNLAQTVRALNSVSKLGAATLSQFPDFLNLVNENRLVRGNNFAEAWVDVMKNYFGKITPEKQKVLDRLGVMADTINFGNFNRFDADNINNRLGRMSDTLFKITGQNWHTRKAKGGFALMLSKDLGELHGMKFDELPKGLQETLTQYGSIDAKKWEVIQKVSPEDVDGDKYFHPDLIDKLSDSDLEDLIPEDLRGDRQAQYEMDLPEGVKFEPGEKLKKWKEDRADALERARFGLANDLRTFFIEETRNAVLEPDLKVKRQITFGTKSGTNAGEAIRLMTQFKSFAVAYYDRSMKGKRFSKTGDMSDYGGVIHHAVASVALGYISMVAKDLSKGKEPRDPAMVQTWMQAGIQSGGLGIFGDFLQASMGRTSSTLIETAAGPTVGTIANVAHLGGRVLTGVYKEGRGEDGDFDGIIADAVDIGKAQIPFQSLWYTRAAADYLFWYNLKESLEPGSTARSERRLRQEFNQEYLISPSEVISQ